MMKALLRCWLAMCLVGSFSLVWSQHPMTDSLESVVDTMPDDSDKVLYYLRAFKTLLFLDGEGAMRFTERGDSLAGAIGYKHGQAEAARLQGVYYMYNGAHSLALEKYQMAYDMFRELGNKPAMVRSANNFATVYIELEQYDTALTYVRTYHEFEPDNPGDSVMVATMRHNEAICLDMLGDHEGAYHTFSENLKVFERLHSVYEQSFTLSSMGEVAIKLGKYNDAITHLRAAQARKAEIGDKRGEGNVLILMALAYQKLGKPDSANVIALRGEAAIQGFPDALAEGLKTMAEIAAAQGQWEKAYSLIHRHDLLSDSLDKASNHARLLSLQAAYGLKNKNAEIKQLEQARDLDEANLSQQRILIFSLVGGIVLVLVLLGLMWRGSRLRARHHAEIAAKNLQLSAANDTLQHFLHERESILHMVIHDLKSPLTNTDAMLQMMRDVDGMPAEALAMMDRMDKSNRRGMELIADLLALYQLETQASVSMAAVDTAAVLQGVIADARAAASKKNIGLQVQVAEGLPALHTNASMLSRIIENLVSNALKFSPAGTEVQVLLQQVDRAVVLTVVDQGPGISAADQLRLFQKFTKLSARPTGGEHSNGLGLAIVKKLAERIGADVGVRSELGKGAAFWVSLPLQAPGKTA